MSKDSEFDANSSVYTKWCDTFLELAKSKGVRVSGSIAPFLYMRGFSPQEAVDQYEALQQDLAKETQNQSIGFVPSMAVYHKQLGLGTVADIDPHSKACWCFFLGYAPKVKVLCETLTIIPDQSAFGKGIAKKLQAYLRTQGDFFKRWNAFEVPVGEDII